MCYRDVVLRGCVIRCVDRVCLLLPILCKASLRSQSRGYDDRVCREGVLQGRVERVC